MRRRNLTWLFLALILTNATVVDASERLKYRLSYSGLLTGFFWKRLANVNFSLIPEQIEFRNQSACRLSMEIDSSGYLFAEMIHPVRYRWESTISPSLQQTWLSRTIDTGKSDVHEVSWYDWENSAISLFRKRKEIDKNRDSFESEPDMVWEENHYPPPASFIDPQPQIESGLRYLIQTGQFENRLSKPAIDPLTMIQHTRHHPFKQLETLEMLVVIDEELHHYQARLQEQSPLRIDEQHHPSTLKIEIARMEESGLKGKMHIWLKDDARRIPLRIDIQAPLGMIHLELHQSHMAPESKKCEPKQIVNRNTTSS